MTDKYQGKYRIASARASWWDYGRQASYFITICTKYRRHFFGEIVRGNVILSDIGRTVEIEWRKTTELRSDMNLHLGPFVIMPNHVHGIITIGENQYNTYRRDAMHRVSTVHRVSTSSSSSSINNTPHNQFAPQSKNLASIVRGFKSAVTTTARKSGNNVFGWQPRFHDHIIRDDSAYQRIARYIANNPARWQNDTFYTLT